MRHYSALIALAAIALIAACQDQTMTGVDRSPTAARSDLVVKNSNADNAQYAVDDVMARIVPTLSDAKAAQGLVAAMQGLQQAMHGGNAADTPGLVRAAETQLEQYSRGADADPGGTPGTDAGLRPRLRSGTAATVARCGTAARAGRRIAAIPAAPDR